MEVAEDIKALELFNEKADELKESRFAHSLESEDSGWTFTLLEGETSASRFGPDDESYKAFVLTLRLFIQDNEQISIRNMAKRYKRLYDGSLISKELLDNYDDARQKLLTYLDSNTRFIVVEQGERHRVITHREVREVFMYGDLAHLNKKEQFDNWKKDTMQVVFPGLENYFVMILKIHLQVILYIRGLNEKVLRALKTP